MRRFALLVTLFLTVILAILGFVPTSQFKVGDSFRDGWVIESIEGQPDFDYMPQTTPVGVNHSKIVVSHGWGTQQEWARRDFSFRCKAGEVVLRPSYYCVGHQVHEIEGGVVLSNPYGSSDPGDPVICDEKPLGSFTMTRKYNGGVERLTRYFYQGKRFAPCDNAFPTPVVIDRYRKVPIKVIPPAPPGETSQLTVIEVDVQYFTNVQYNTTQVIQTPAQPTSPPYGGWRGHWVAGPATTTDRSFGVPYFGSWQSGGGTFVPILPPGSSQCPPGSVIQPPVIPPPPGVTTGPNGGYQPPWVIDPNGNKLPPNGGPPFQRG